MEYTTYHIENSTSHISFLLENSHEDLQRRPVYLSVIVLIIITAFVSNLTVVLCILLDSQLRSTCVVYVYLFSLAVADLVVSIFAMSGKAKWNLWKSNTCIISGLRSFCVDKKTLIMILYFFINGRSTLFSM